MVESSSKSKQCKAMAFWKDFGGTVSYLSYIWLFFFFFTFLPACIIRDVIGENVLEFKGNIHLRERAKRIYLHI